MLQPKASSTLSITGDRSARLQALATEGKKWDFIVIGGGASGLGIALEAVSRGYSVLLLERSDFAKGTSSRSTKLVHGGVRYLAQGNIRLVREASIERAILRRNAPHLVSNQVFLVPVYSWFGRLKYTVGLKLYDWIAGRRSFGSSYFISREEATRLLPGIKSERLKGAVRYHDGQFDDARLAISLVQTFTLYGGEAINYMEVTSLDAGLSDNRQQDTNTESSGAEQIIATAMSNADRDHGPATGTNVSFSKKVVAVDKETGTAYSFNSRILINATGVFVDSILRMLSSRHIETVRVSQGIHLVLPASFYPSKEALMIPETSDGRVLFAVPWHGYVVVGTTDTPVDSSAIEPVALEKEIDFLLQTATQYFASPPQRSDVLSVFAGLRPLAAPAAGKQKTKEISRSHKIISGPDGVYTMIGGKWTTYRKMGEDMIDVVEKDMQWKATVSVTAKLAIHGSTVSAQGVIADKHAPGLPVHRIPVVQSVAEDANNLWWYGADHAAILKLITLSGKPWIEKNMGLHEETIRWAVRYEMARTVEDMLARRTRLLFVDAAKASSLAPQVAEFMAMLLGHDQVWQQSQVESFQLLCRSYLLTH